MKKDMDAQFLCKDCERYNLCKYYHNRKEDSYICKYFHLPNKLDKIRAEVEKLDYLSIEDGSDGYDRYIDQQDVLQILDKYKADKEYEAKVITRGNCMYCGKELTEGLFFCKECEAKVIQGRSEKK